MNFLIIYFSKAVYWVEKFLLKFYIFLDTQNVPLFGDTFNEVKMRSFLGSEGRYNNRKDFFHTWLSFLLGKEFLCDHRNQYEIYKNKLK